MLTKIQDYIEDPQALVCVLTDEVESLTHARQSSLAGTETSDSLRVVNAVHRLFRFEATVLVMSSAVLYYITVYYMHFTTNLQMSIK
jgi:hypothetical protein